MALSAFETFMSRDVGSPQTRPMIWKVSNTKGRLVSRGFRLVRSQRTDTEIWQIYGLHDFPNVFPTTRFRRGQQTMLQAVAVSLLTYQCAPPKPWLRRLCGSEVAAEVPRSQLPSCPRRCCQSPPWFRLSTSVGKRETVSARAIPRSSMDSPVTGSG